MSARRRSLRISRANRLSLSKTLSWEDSRELVELGMFAGDGCDPQAAESGRYAIVLRRGRLEAEVIVLRHQLNILRRQWAEAS